MEPKRPSEPKRRLFGGSCHTTERDRRNQWRVVGWSLAWVASWLVAGMASDWLGRVAGGVVIAVSALLGLGMLWAYRRFLREADELRRKIELDALALAFGIGLVAGFTEWLLVEYRVLAEPEILSILVLMVITHTLGLVIGHRRYA